MTTSTLTPTQTRTQIPAGTWKIDPAHTRVGFAVKHLGVATVRGEFQEFEGAIEIGEDLSASRAYGTVNAASVNTNQAQRDEHLRSSDFFTTESHPELTFESKAIEAVDEDTLRVVGELTINGVTNDIELTAEIGGTTVGIDDEERLGLEVTGQLSRKDYGMKFDGAAGSGNALVADKVKLVLDVAAVKEA